MSAEEETDCEEMPDEEGTAGERKAKKPKTGGGGGAGIKAQIAELTKQKKAAAKAEDFAEALRLKQEIEALEEKASADVVAAKAAVEAKAAAKKAAVAAKAEAKAAAKGVKRAAPEEAEPEPIKPAVEELERDPFFDDKTSRLLAPGCATATEREAWRAVQNRDYKLLSTKIVGSLPLFCPRDVATRFTPLHLAILNADTKSMCLLARKALDGGFRDRAMTGSRAPTLTTDGTGKMCIETLGFETGKIGVARGGRELNNALADSAENPEPIAKVIGRADLTEEQVSLLLGMDMINGNAVCRRGKIRWYGGDPRNPFRCNMGELLEPALSNGRFGIAKALIPKLSAFGAGVGHQAAVKDEPLPSLQGRSVTAKLRFGNITPVHLAAINPDATKIGEMLKTEPTAIAMATETGLLPVHCAAACASPGPLQLLLSEWSADRKALGPDKRTPLHYAAAAGRAENVTVLMGGSGMGAVGGTLFTKEIRSVLGRQKSPMKIGADGICVLSRLLVDVLHRIATEAKRKVDAGQGATSGMSALHQATKQVLKGSLAGRIREKAGKLAAGKLGLPALRHSLTTALQDSAEDALQDMFNKVDKNGNGKLEREEIKAVFEAAGIKHNKKQFQKVLKEMDTDGNGDVSLEEFSSWMSAESTNAVALRKHLVVEAGEMGQAEVAEAEAATEEDLLKGVDKLAFDARPLLDLVKCPGADAAKTRAAAGELMSAILECTCSKVLEVSANAARSQKKTSISQDHLMNSVRSNEELQSLYQADTVVMNSVLLQAKDKSGYQALHLASEAGHLAVVETLLACGADTESPGPDRKTALVLAAERGHVACVKAIIKAGAKLEAGDKRKRTALLLAVRSGHTVAASVLLHAGANPNAADDSGNTIVHYAAAFGWEHCIALLHKAGAELSTGNAMKLAPIMAALQKGHKTVFRKMLEMGIDVNFRDADGSTLLLRCLGSVNRLVYEEIKFMLARGADPMLASSVDKTTALHAVAKAAVGAEAAVYVAHPFEADRLAKVTGWQPRPQEKNPHDISAEDSDDEAAGEPAAKKPRTDEKEEVDEKVHRRGFFQLTIAEREAVFTLGFSQAEWYAGTNPTQLWSTLDEKKKQAAGVLGLDESTWPAVPVRVVKGTRGDSGKLQTRDGMALGATEAGMVSVKYLTGGAETIHISYVTLMDEDVEEVWRQTPHVTVGIAKMLVEKGASVDARDAQGSTPLLLACKAGNVDLALYLLEAGADPNAQQDPPELTPEQKKKTQPRSLTPMAAVPQAPLVGLQRGTWTINEAVAKLLAKGAKVDFPPTEVDASPMLSFMASGDYRSAALLLDARASPAMDATGTNALHILLKASFGFSYTKVEQRQSMASPLPLVMKLLGSAEWGAKLMAEHTRSEPHVTPLFSLMQSFSGSGKQNTAELQTLKAELLRDILAAIPGGVDLSQWARAEPEEERKKRGLTTPAPTAASPLSSLCNDEYFQHCPQLGTDVVTMLCKRGVSPNATAGSPAAVHSLMMRLSQNMHTSSLAKVLLPLTDLSALMPNGHTLLTHVLASQGMQSSPTGVLPYDNHTRLTIKLLLECKCDPDVANEAKVDARRPLHWAAMRRDEGLISDLVAAKANPNGIDNPESRRVPLHYAVSTAPTGSTASFDVEEVLLRAKADPCAADAHGWTVLHYAFLKEHEGALRKFEGWLKRASAEEHDKRQHWTPMAKQVMTSRIDPIETISSLCALTGMPINVKDVHGMSPLHLASLRGSSIAALKLINAKADLEDEFSGNTALGLAMQVYPDMAVLLMQRSASTTRPCTLFGNWNQVSTTETGRPESMFSLALRRIASSPGDLAATYLGAAIAALDCGFPRSQALNDTVSSSQFVMLLTLIPKVGDETLRTQRFEGGQNVLHRLAARGEAGADVANKAAFVKAARKLLERGVPIEPDGEGRTPLHLAAKGKLQELVSMLLSQGAVKKEVVTALDAKGVSALGAALLGACPNSDVVIRITRELISRGASAKAALVCPEKKLHALSYCITSEAEVAEGWPQDKLCWPQVLYALEAPDLTLTDELRRSCLSLAAMRASGAKSLSYLRLIMHWAKSADATRAILLGADGCGVTPLMHAIDAGNLGFVDRLLQEAHAVSPDLLREMFASKAADATTPLMRAIEGADRVGMVCVLLRWADDRAMGSMLSAKDKEGRTPLMRAVLRNSTAIVQMLVAGRPMRPVPQETTCPQGKMAGQTALAQVSYAAAHGGDGPRYHIQWLSDRGVAPAVAGRIVHADGVPGAPAVPLLKEAPAPGMAPGAPAALLPTGAAVSVVGEYGVWLEVTTPTQKGFVEARHVRREKGAEHIGAAGGRAAAGGLAAVLFDIALKMPAGTGPGVKFTVEWDAATGGPGLPGLAGGFAGDAAAPSRAPKASLEARDAGGRTAAELCVSPLPFGSYENTEILSMLLRAGVPADKRVGELAGTQRSGRMLRCLQELGAPVPTGAAARMDVDGAGVAAGPWPESVDVQAEAAKALAIVESKRQKVEGKPEPPLDQSFQKPSPTSRVKVANGKDGLPLDLVMTKVDLSRPFCPQNVFYRMQVIHESNQDHFFLFTRWGPIGAFGQFQRTPFESLEKAEAEFCKIFKSKAGNDWANRAHFERKPNKYLMHEIKYEPTTAAKDALATSKWRRLPTKEAPLDFRRVLNVGSCQQLLAHVLRGAKLSQPLGSLKSQPLEEAKELLGRIRKLIREKDDEVRKPEPSGKRFQELLDEIAELSSRVYELVPTSGYNQVQVGPINDINKVRQWYQSLQQADDVTCAAQLLLGAQANLSRQSPTDFIYRGLGVRVTPLGSGSEELHLIQRFINRSAPRECMLFDGEGAIPLKEKKEVERLPLAERVPRWQVLQDAVCYHSPECTRESHAGKIVVAGCLVREFAQQGGVVRINEDDKGVQPLWVRATEPDGAQALKKLSDRERASKIAAVYRIDRRGEENRAGGETATLLYHGSGMANALAILSQGLRVKPPDSFHNGSAFGNGIYFANSFAKSRAYCQLHNGVGFMLLCEVSPGRLYESKDFNFFTELTAAHLAAARKRLGLAPDTPVDKNHPELVAAAEKIERDISTCEIEDFTGTDYNSFHFQCGTAPDRSGDVMHPDGYRVPCGEVVPAGGRPADEIIVYDASRVRLRYVLELRDPNAYDVFREVKKPTDKDDEEKDSDDEMQGGGGGGGTQPDDDEDEEEKEESEKDEDEEDEDDDE